MLLKELSAKRKKIYLLLLSAIVFVLFSNVLFSQNKEQMEQDILSKAKIEAARKEVDLTIQSVDISKFPVIKVLIEAYNKLGEPLDSLSPDNVYIYENGERKEVLEVKKIPVAERTAVDFIFVIDKTGSMQQYIDAVRNNVVSFTQKLVKKGINYKLGLILFSDEVEKVYQPTNDVYEFLNWISNVKAFGGGDEKENALEAISAATKLNYRVEANKVLILVTDAPYHQVGETGEGLTRLSQKSIIETMQKSQTRVFCIVPEKLNQYAELARRTRGNYYDLDYPFSTVLDNFSNQLTNLYDVVYQSGKPTIPDSIEIGFYDVKQNKLIKRTIPIVELGRKLILEHLLFGVASYQLPENIEELNILAEFMKSRPAMKIMIEGHTDFIGEVQSNQILSEKRAEEVKLYLIRKGISADRIQSVGFGEMKPIASNLSNYGRQLNRRTEIVILSK